jgi:hypothetical protein
MVSTRAAGRKLGAATSYMAYLLSGLHATWTSVNERLAGGGGCPAPTRHRRLVIDRVRLLSLSRSYGAGSEGKLHRQGRTSTEQSSAAHCLEAAAIYTCRAHKQGCASLCLACASNHLHHLLLGSTAEPNAPSDWTCTPSKRLARWGPSRASFILIHPNRTLVSTYFPRALSLSSTSFDTIFSRMANSPFADPSKYPATLFSTYLPTWSTSMLTSSPGFLLAVTTFSCV